MEIRGRSSPTELRSPAGPGSAPQRGGAAGEGVTMPHRAMLTLQGCRTEPGVPKTSALHAVETAPGGAAGAGKEISAPRVPPFLSSAHSCKEGCGEVSLPSQAPHPRFAARSSTDLHNAPPVVPEHDAPPGYGWAPPEGLNSPPSQLVRKPFPSFPSSIPASEQPINWDLHAIKNLPH